MSSEIGKELCFSYHKLTIESGHKIEPFSMVIVEVLPSK